MERIPHHVSDDGGTGREEEHLMVRLESLSDIPGNGEKGIDPTVVLFGHEERIALLDLFNHLEGRFLIDRDIHFRDKVLGIFLFPDFSSSSSGESSDGLKRTIMLFLSDIAS